MIKLRNRFRLANSDNYVKVYLRVFSLVCSDSVTSVLIMWTSLEQRPPPLRASPNHH